MTDVIRDLASLRTAVGLWHKAGATVGVVPTMGALHAGHMSLVRAAQAECNYVIVTIFVNPKQFNTATDLANYPRTETADLALLRAAGVNVLFAPSPEEVYPAGFATTVSVGGVAGPLEGAARPGHFDGVATVVAKIFGMTRADRAYFGQKDWQQLQVVRRMVADLHLPIQIIGCETLREADGLAMSSRNMRLSPKARQIAPSLYAALQHAAAAVRMGDESALENCAQAVLAAGFDSVDYIELRNGETLAPISPQSLIHDASARMFAAVWLNGVRLIDNVPT